MERIKIDHSALDKKNLDYYKRNQVKGPYQSFSGRFENVHSPSQQILLSRQKSLKYVIHGHLGQIRLLGSRFLNQNRAVPLASDCCGWDVCY